jgi:hypothetical protein
MQKLKPKHSDLLVGFALFVFLSAASIKNFIPLSMVNVFPFF